MTGPAVDSTLTVAFGTDGKVGGNGGVNTFSGDFESGPSSVKIGPLASTKMAGSPELMAQESRVPDSAPELDHVGDPVGQAHDA